MDKKIDLMLEEYFKSEKTVSEDLKAALREKLYKAEIKKRKRMLLIMSGISVLLSLLFTAILFILGGVTIGLVITAAYIIIAASLSVVFVMLTSKYIVV